MTKIGIKGAGISGLAAAYFLQQRGFEVTVYEKSSRVGGWIETKEEKGFLFEMGPRGFRTDPTTLELCQALNLKPLAASSAAKHRFVVKKGRLNRFSPLFLLSNGLFGAWLRDRRCRSSTLDDESIGDFSRRHFGAKMTEYLFDPLVKGIFAGDLDTLSMRSCFPALWKKDQKQGPVMGGRRPKTTIYSFPGGMETLPKRLAEEVEVKLNTPFPDEHSYDHVISTIDGPEMPLLSVTTISLGWNDHVLPKRGFGFLAPSQERLPLLGMTWDSEVFPQHNQQEQTRLCIMTRDQESEKAITAGLTLAGITRRPDVCVIKKNEQAIPQYPVRHHALVKDFLSALPANYHTIGTRLQGVGVNDCIKNALLLSQHI